MILYVIITSQNQHATFCLQPKIYIFPPCMRSSLKWFPLLHLCYTIPGPKLQPSSRQCCRSCCPARSCKRGQPRSGRLKKDCSCRESGSRLARSRIIEPCCWNINLLEGNISIISQRNNHQAKVFHHRCFIQQFETFSEIKIPSTWRP